MMMRMVVHLDAMNYLFVAYHKYDSAGGHTTCLTACMLSAAPCHLYIYIMGFWTCKSYYCLPQEEQHVIGSILTVIMGNHYSPLLCNFEQHVQQQL